MSTNTYGVNTPESGYIDVSSTLRGAKNYATRNGFKQVYIRYNNGYNVALKSEKCPITNKWLDV